MFKQFDKVEEVEDKSKIRFDINKQIEEFFAKGKTIETIPFGKGVMSETEFFSHRETNKRTMRINLAKQKEDNLC